MPTTELLNRDELAAKLKVASSTVSRWRVNGTIPCIRINATTFRFDYEDVVNALRARSRSESSDQKIST